MKHKFLPLIFTFFILHFTFSITTAQDPSAVTEFESTTQGILLPRMTESQRDAIASPATGLLIYQTDEQTGFYYNVGTPASPQWIRLGAIAGELSDADGDTKVQVEKSPDEDVIRFDIGGSQFLEIQRNVFGFARIEMENVALGEDAYLNNQTGTHNIPIGAFSMLSNISGSNNVAAGFSTLRDNTSGYSNTAVGISSLRHNLTGYHNTALGMNALFDNQHGDRNTAVGSAALLSLLSGDNNTAVGESSLRNIESGFRNTAVGKYAMREATGGSDNTAMGYYSLGGGALTSSNNTAIGAYALQQNTNTYNTAVGSRSLESNTTGYSNTAVGYSSMTNSKAGQRSVSFGANAGINDTMSVDNVYLGYQAGRGGGLFADFKHAKKQNVFVGSNAGYNNHGDGNVMIGYQAGYFDTTSHKLYIENSTAQESEALIYGDFENDFLRVNQSLGVGREPTTNAFEVNGDASKTSAGDWLANSDERLKKKIEQMSGEEILALMLQLRGVTYIWNDDKTGADRPEGMQYGLIAQDVQKAFPTLVSEDGDGYLQTGYGTYDAMYIEIIRHLSNRIALLEKTNADLVEKCDYNESDLAVMKMRMAKLESKLEELTESPQ